MDTTLISAALRRIESSCDSIDQVAKALSGEATSEKSHPLQYFELLAEYLESLVTSLSEEKVRFSRLGDSVELKEAALKTLLDQQEEHNKQQGILLEQQEKLLKELEKSAVAHASHDEETSRLYKEVTKLSAGLRDQLSNLSLPHNHDNKGNEILQRTDSITEKVAALTATVKRVRDVNHSMTGKLDVIATLCAQKPSPMPERSIPDTYRDIENRSSFSHAGRTQGLSQNTTTAPISGYDTIKRQSVKRRNATAPDLRAVKRFALDQAVPGVSEAASSPRVIEILDDDGATNVAGQETTREKAAASSCSGSAVCQYSHTCTISLSQGENRKIALIRPHSIPIPDSSPSSTSLTSTQVDTSSAIFERVLFSNWGKREEALSRHVKALVEGILVRHNKSAGFILNSFGNIVAAGSRHCPVAWLNVGNQTKPVNDLQSRQPCDWCSHTVRSEHRFCARLVKPSFPCPNGTVIFVPRDLSFGGSANPSLLPKDGS